MVQFLKNSIDKDTCSIEWTPFRQVFEKIGNHFTVLVAHPPACVRCTARAERNTGAKLKKQPNPYSPLLAKCRAHMKKRLFWWTYHYDVTIL